MKWQPRAYQFEAAKHILSNPGAALFLEPGLGKTSTTLAGLKTLLKHKHAKRALIIAPLRVCYSVWPREAAKWDDFKGMEIAILHGAGKEAALRSKAQICVVNPEGLPWLVAQPELKEFDALVVDESTKFKNRQTQRFELLKTHILGRAKWRWILTGTPAPRNLMDLWSQMFIVDGGERLGRFITRFRNEYFDEVFNGFAREYHPRPDTAGRIEAKIKDVALYMSAVDHLDMPSLVVNEISVELPRAAQSVYTAIEENALAVLRDSRVSVAQKSAAQMKLRQITGGAVYDDSGKALVTHTAKYDALVDLVEEQNGQPLLVAVGFKHEAEQLQARLKKEFKLDVPYLGGGISPRASDDIAARWNAGELPVLLAHPASVAHGLNLQAGGHSVAWMTPTWSLEEYLQFNGRVWRQGQKSKTVIVHHVVARETVDEDVFAALAARKDVQQTLLDAFKKGA